MDHQHVTTRLEGRNFAQKHVKLKKSAFKKRNAKFDAQRLAIYAPLPHRPLRPQHQIPLARVEQGGSLMSSLVL